MKRFMCLMVLGGLTALGSAQTIQNGDFSSNAGWELRGEQVSIQGGFLTLSAFFVGEKPQARQRSTSTASRRTVEVEVSDLDQGVTDFEIGWENEAGTSGHYVRVTQEGVASATTDNPTFTFIVFRADRDRLGLSAQKLDNALVLESVTPTPENEYLNHLTGEGPPPENPDPNNDGEEDVADLVTLINQKNAP